MKQLGFGMAVAIALDATVIRLVVVPASMRLMGAWNWWLPGRRHTRARRAAPRRGPRPPVAGPSVDARYRAPGGVPGGVHGGVPAAVPAGVWSA
jgi:RND superfamily putative drug exporter